MSTDPVFMKQSGQYYWYHNDHLGTPQMMTTSSGAVVWKAKYTAFGKATVDPSSTTVMNPLRFPGHYEDSETGLHYNLWRYYDVTIGRYLNTDPIGLDGGINIYLYAIASPNNQIDPLGLKNISGIEITKKHCKCGDGLKIQLKFSKLVQGEFKKAGANSKYKKSNEIYDAVYKSLEKSNISYETAGTYNRNNQKISIKPQKGVCGDLIENALRLHEVQHETWDKKLIKKYGNHTFKYWAVAQTANNAWRDEYEAYEQMILFYEAVINELNQICCSKSP